MTVHEGNGTGVAGMPEIGVAALARSRVVQKCGRSGTPVGSGKETGGVGKAREETA